MILRHIYHGQRIPYFFLTCQRLRRWFIWLSCTFGVHQFQNMGYIILNSIIECTEHQKIVLIVCFYFTCQILNTQTSESVLTFVWQLWRLSLHSFEFYLTMLKNVLSIKETCQAKDWEMSNFLALQKPIHVLKKQPELTDYPTSHCFHRLYCVFAVCVKSWNFSTTANSQYPQVPSMLLLPGM